MQSCKHQARCQHVAALAYRLDTDARATAPKWMQDANSKEKKKIVTGLHSPTHSSTEIFLSNKGVNLCYQKKILACIFSFGDVTESSLILLLTSSWGEKKSGPACLRASSESPRKGSNCQHSHTKENYPASEVNFSPK